MTRALRRNDLLYSLKLKKKPSSSILKGDNDENLIYEKKILLKYKMLPKKQISYIKVL